MNVHTCTTVLYFGACHEYSTLEAVWHRPVLATTNPALDGQNRCPGSDKTRVTKFDQIKHNHTPRFKFLIDILCPIIKNKRQEWCRARISKQVYEMISI